MEVLVIALFFGGGIVAAIASMLGASFLRKSEGIRNALYATTAIALLIQGGCWHMASEIGRATGGHGDDGAELRAIVWWTAGVCVVWAVLIEWLAFRRWQRDRRRKEHPPRDRWF